MTDEPNLISKAKNFTKAVIDHVGSGLKYVSDDIKKDRLEICQKCEHVDKEKVKCLMCGCKLSIKTGWTTSSCPIEKWGKVND